MRGRCDICLEPGKIRCKCKWEDRRGKFPSYICDRCWPDHICMTWMIRLQIWFARRYNLMCPFDRIEFKRLPGYVSAYGCPVCKSIVPYHHKLERR